MMFPQSLKVFRIICWNIRSIQDRKTWHDKKVPEVLMSGHHANIEKWRREQSVIRTAKNRPDLLEKAELTDKERILAAQIQKEITKSE